MEPDEATLLTDDHGLAVLRVEGADASDFLDSQVTADLRTLAENTLAPAALADPGGRVLATFRVWREGDTWRLVLPAGETDWLCTYLRRFLFRSRARIVPDDRLELLALAGSQASAALKAAGLPSPCADAVQADGSLRVAALPGERRLLIGSGDTLRAAALSLEKLLPRADGQCWRQARLIAGEVEIRKETRGRFLPQMLGLVELRAVSFSKGCYPGQEVIARTQHRGRVKRGLALLQLDAPLEAGAASKVGNARIEVLDSVALPEGGALVQAVAPLSSE